MDDRKKDLYYAEPGDHILDKKTGEVWVYRKSYQIGNYLYHQIEKDRKIRKLGLFREPMSTGDVDRYERILELKTNFQKGEYHES